MSCFERNPFLHSYSYQWMNCPGQLVLNEPAQGGELDQRISIDPKAQKEPVSAPRAAHNRKGTGELPPSPSSLSVAAQGTSAWDPLPSWALCPAQQHFSQCHWQGHASVPGGSAIPLLAERHHRPFFPPKQVHTTSNTSLAP